MHAPYADSAPAGKHTPGNVIPEGWFVRPVGATWWSIAFRRPCIVAAFLVLVCGCRGAQGDKGRSTLRLYCGAGLQAVVADAVAAFRARTGITVEADYAGSGMLISRAKLDPKADLFMPGDVWYLEQIEKEGLLESRQMVTYFVPVILVEKGNPKGIRGLADLARPGVRLALGDSRACPVGRLSEQMFAKNGIDAAAVQKNLALSAVTVNELGIQIKTGKLDAVIVWDAIAAQFADCGEAIPIPAAQNVTTRVPVAVLRCSTQPAAAARLAEFLASESGQAIFRKHHYTTALPAP